MTARRNLEWSDGAAGPVLRAVDAPVIDWRARAVCRPADERLFFPPAGPGAERAMRLAKNICATCPVIAECLDWAHRNPETTRYGVWGGLTKDERDHPQVLPVADDGRRKKCCRCGNRKPLSDFYRRADAPDGRQSRCKHCEERDRMKQAAA